MNILLSLRQRIGVVIASVLAAIFFCASGAFFAFVLAPKQAIEARRISNLPQMDASYVASAPAGEDILVTGTLMDNPPLLDDSELVAYHLEEWQVTLPDANSNDNTPDGDWNTLERIAPDLNLDVGGQRVQVLSASNMDFSGNLREELVYGDGVESAEYNGQQLPQGSLRYRGFYNGDLTTVLGQKATSGGIVPEKLFAGDRVAFEQSEKDAAKGMFIGGIVFMACAPLVLVGGILSAIFGRRRRRGILG